MDSYTRIATEVIICALKDYRDPFLRCPRQNVRIQRWLTRGQGRTWCELIGIEHTVDRILKDTAKLNDNARARGAPGTFHEGESSKSLTPHNNITIGEINQCKMVGMRLLDLFCGAGGAGMGYHLAGFDVVGIDINPQPHYPFKFIQSDALVYLKEHGHEFDVIHASPPCQAYSQASIQWRKSGKDYPDLIEPTRKLLKQIGKPYIIENVPGAPLINPTILTGAYFGLKVRRRRLFETSFPVDFILLPTDGKTNFRMGRPIRDGEEITPVGHFSNIPYARKEMGIDWMTGKELTQAIPPAYTEFIGKQLLETIE